MSATEPARTAPGLPDDCAVVACGTLRSELRCLADNGVVRSDRLFFTAPGLHEWPGKLKEQLVRQVAKARSAAPRVIVAYGEKCYFDVATGADTDALLAELGPDTKRVSAKHCVDMLAGENDRQRLAGGDTVYWLTPGWVQHWDFIFKDWDAAKANETFPAHDRGVVLDGVGYFEELMRTDPEKILRIGDWAKLPLEPQPVSLNRLRGLLRECGAEGAMGAIHVE